jgi:hypothetical protein
LRCCGAAKPIPTTRVPAKGHPCSTLVEIEPGRVALEPRRLASGAARGRAQAVVQLHAQLAKKNLEYENVFAQAVHLIQRHGSLCMNPRSRGGH